VILPSQNRFEDIAKALDGLKSRANVRIVMNRHVAEFVRFGLVAFALSACAVGVSTATGGGDIDDDAGSAANDTSGSQSYGDNGDAAAPPTKDSGKAATDSGSKSVIDSGSPATSGTCAAPSTPADCTCASGHTCAANNCYSGYVCDTSDNKCKAASACP
jgi:hypothetical protein